MRRLGIIAGIFLVVCLVFTCLRAQADGVPQLINYQGYLTDKDGAPLATAEYTLSFSIYTAPTGGTAAWGPQTFNKVPVVRGYFNVILPINDVFRSSATTYLEIAVNNGSPIAPRQQILSTPYAIEAKHAVNATYATNADNGRDIRLLVPPIGSVIAWTNHIENTPALPDGWVRCDGQQINDTASVFNGKATPDMNHYSKYGGRFLRGGTMSGVPQSDYIIQHTHSYTGWTLHAEREAGGYTYANFPHTEQSGGVSGTPRVSDSETFPANMTVIWIMRIK